MDLKRARPAILTLFMIYNLLLAGIWILRAPQAAAMPAMVLLHFALAYLLLVWSEVGGGRLARRPLVLAVPWLFWGLAWSEIGWLYRLSSPTVHDGAIRWLDRALLGTHLNEHLAALVPWRPVPDLMGLAYLSYYLLILGPPLVLALRRRHRRLANHTGGLIGTYLFCFTVYLVLPVLGPREVAAAAGQGTGTPPGLFGPLIHAMFAAGDSLGTAFPSSHCAGSVAAALLIRRHFGPAAGGLAAVWAGLIVLSTVYTNNHYGIDAAAGVAVAVLMTQLGTRREGRRARGPATAALGRSASGSSRSGGLVTEERGG